MNNITDRDRLIELICDKPFTTEYENYNSFEWAEHFADYLLANGVIVKKQGEWQVHQNNEYWHYDCPFCDDGYATKGQDKSPPNYCGNCGAELKEREG